MSEAITAWAKVHAVFGSMPNVKYEVPDTPNLHVTQFPNKVVNRWIFMDLPE